jgi:hypothetical protein
VVSKTLCGLGEAKEGFAQAICSKIWRGSTAR